MPIAIAVVIFIGGKVSGEISQCGALFWVEPHKSVTLSDVEFSTSTEIYIQKCHTLMLFNPKPSVTP